MEMTRDEVLELLDGDGNTLLIDVLPHEQFDAAHIPGSLSVPLDDRDFVAEIDELTDGDRSLTIIVYCASFRCSASTTAMEHLRRAGFTDVRDFKGGMEDWQGAGLPVQSGVSAG